MKSITNFINESEVINEAAVSIASIKDLIYQIAKQYNFDYNQTVQYLQNKDWDSDYFTRNMSNAVFSKFMETMRAFTEDENSFNKLIKSEEKQKEKREAANKASANAKVKAIEEAFGELINNGVRIRISDDRTGTKGPVYKLSIDNDGTLVFILA
jgi:uncharacterized protein YeeX (DUF496 family)